MMMPKRSPAIKPICRKNLRPETTALQSGPATNLQTIAASIADLKGSIARIERERQELAARQKARQRTTHRKKDSWDERGFWIIG